MPYRLMVHLGDRALRFPLEPGENAIGSSPDCAVTIRHPTLSRHHALLAVGDDELLITDLNSTNGTRVDGSSVHEQTSVSADSKISLGSVEVRIEFVGAGDLETGVELPLSAALASGHGDGVATPVSTVGPAALETFTLKHLPGLAAAVARGDSMTELAQEVGGALLRSLPCRKVEVVDPDGGDAVLFTGERGGGGEEVSPVVADAGNGRQLRVSFLGPVFASTYEPVVHAAAALVRAAGARAVPRDRSASSTPDPPEPPRPPSLVPEMRDIYTQAARVAGGPVSVLIRGESGTGKELLARYLHAASDRADQLLVTLNCAALPRDLLESELFGVERGVATGVEARAGKFEAAHGSTLFLDEIGDMAPETQARILRVLQEGEVFRIGSHVARPADVRVISATNRDIDGMLEDGRFRRDLYHRIADWVVELPPLRRRRADIPNLAAHFLSRAAGERGISVAGISRSALDALIAYDWPGNVRQLEKEMGRSALFLEDRELLDTSRLQPVIVEAQGAARNDTLKKALEQAEREHIQRVLADCDGAVTTAAERLEIGVSTLYRRMKALGIE